MKNIISQQKSISKTEVMVTKVHKLLIENNYIQAYDLAIKCNLKVSSIFRIIRKIRLSGIGVIATNKGYILSEFASQSDDLHFIRNCYGRRISDYIAIEAAKKDINKRWTNETDRKALSSMFGPIDVQLSQINKGIKLLTEVKDRIVV